MTTIDERLHIRCPYVRAREYLHESMEVRARSKEPYTMRLRADLPMNLEMYKSVFVRYGLAQDPMHFDEPWQVRWSPERGGVYPSFEGELTVRADESYRLAILELKGAYSPPLGGPGRLFDAAVGRKIAESTAQTLLSEIAAEMESRYTREEAQKTRSVP